MRYGTAKVEIGVGTFLLLVGGLTYEAAYRLPAGVFDPLGSGTVPMVIAALVACLSVGMLGHGVMTLYRARAGTVAADAPELRERRWLAILSLAATLGYAAVLESRAVDFAIATALFLAFLISMLSDWRWRRIPWAIGIGIFAGVALKYVFTNIFVVDLP